MKRNRRYNLFGWLAASMLLMTAACADNADLYAGMPQDNANGDTNTVTFTIQPQSQTATSRRAANRRDGEEDNTTSENNRDYFGDGTKTDVLIFAIYEKEGDDWKLLTNFGGKDGASLGTKLGSGQNSLSVTAYPVTIQLTLGAGKKYRAAFWAQDSKCGAYDTKDLKAVKVSYKDTDGTTDAANNDESRDAFCAYTEFEGSDKNVTATLKRPFAQVNVGTAGWDYEGAAILKPNAVTYTQSTITLKGVAQYYNVLEGKAIVDNTDHQTTDATFSYSKIPAFVKVTDETIKSTEKNYLPFTNEEYLKVNLNYDKSYGYVGWDAFKDNTSDELPKTEKYKYLSMCYILVPEATSSPAVGNPDKDGNVTDTVGKGAVLTSVVFNTKGIYVEDETAADGTTITKGTEYEFKDKDKGVFTIYNVPVQKNWRTNILGNSFYTTNQAFIVDIVPDYCGDYNNVNEDDKWQNLTLTGSDEEGWHYTGKGNPNEGFGGDEHDHDSDYNNNKE